VLSVLRRAYYGPEFSLAASGSFRRVTTCSVDGLPIRCNAVLPVMIDTPMTSSMAPAYGSAWETRTCLERFARPQEIAEVIAFPVPSLASDSRGSPMEHNYKVLMDHTLIHRAAITYTLASPLAILY
jgi:hypothetical protein